jgi:peptidoglycan/LPS O-acetylase OafA/YrhL
MLPTRPAARIGALDGLRGFAALAVVTTHADVSLGLLPYASGGFIGVLIFFVLSGYLITGICWRTTTTAASYAAFVRRRVQRLAGVILALVIVGTPLLVLLGGVPVAKAAISAGVSLAQVTGFAIPLGLTWHPVWLPTWSLTTEWVFYLLFPLVLLVAHQKGVDAKRIRNGALGAMVSLFVLGLGLDATSFYILPVANLAVMLAGAALALQHVASPTRRPIERSHAAAAMLLLALLVFLPGSALGWTYRVILPAVAIATALVIHGCSATTGVARVLAHRALTLVGVRAYSLYLWHMPVFWLVWFNTRGLAAWAQLGLSTLLLVPTVAVSYNLLERPWLKARQPSVQTRGHLSDDPMRHPA